MKWFLLETSSLTSESHSFTTENIHFPCFRWVVATGWKLMTTLGVQSDLLLWIIPSNENRVHNWDDILSNENHVHNNFWLRYFFKNIVIGPCKSGPNQINHAKQSRENNISILLISSVRWVLCSFLSLSWWWHFHDQIRLTGVQTTPFIMNTALLQTLQTLIKHTF